jgi:hypothetical protein
MTRDIKQIAEEYQNRQSENVRSYLSDFLEIMADYHIAFRPYGNAYYIDPSYIYLLGRYRDHDLTFTFSKSGIMICVTVRSEHALTYTRAKSVTKLMCKVNKIIRANQ